MSLNPFNAPLALTIKPSLQKWLLIIVPHFIAFVIVLTFSVFTFTLKAGLTFLILFSFVYYFRLHLQQSLKKSVYLIHQDSAKNWFVITKDTERKEVTLSGSSFVSKLLIIINYNDINNNQYGVIVTPDSLSIDDFRQLIVRIKLT